LGRGQKIQGGLRRSNGGGISLNGMNSGITLDAYSRGIERDDG